MSKFGYFLGGVLVGAAGLTLAAILHDKYESPTLSPSDEEISHGNAEDESPIAVALKDISTFDDDNAASTPA